MINSTIKPGQVNWLFILAVATGALLLFTYLNALIFNLKGLFFGVFQELLLLPSIICQPVIIVLSIRELIKSGKSRPTTVLALTISIIMLIAVVFSFLTD